VARTSETTDPIKLTSRDLIDKSVHTKGGDLIGNVDSVHKDFVIVKRNVVNAIYYHIPKERFEQWDGHALWLNITEKQAQQDHMSTTRDSRRGFETTTFRLNERIMDNIRTEAENRTISINTLVNHILKRFVEWDKLEPISEMIHIAKPVVIELFNKKSNEEVISLAKSVGKNAISNAVLFMKGERDLYTFLSWLDTEMNNHSLKIRHTIEGNTHTYIMKHGMGEKVSLYYRTIIESIFNDYMRQSIDTNISDELLAFKFES
jgi:predicted DNA-binding ribbon-helix-helix protein